MVQPIPLHEVNETTVTTMMTMEDAAAVETPAPFSAMELAWVLDGVLGDEQHKPPAPISLCGAAGVVPPALLKSRSLELSADDLRQIDALLGGHDAVDAAAPPSAPAVTPAAARPLAPPPPPPTPLRRPEPAAASAPEIVFVPCGRNGFRAVVVGVGVGGAEAAAAAAPRGAPRARAPSAGSPTSVTAITKLTATGLKRRRKPKREKRVVYSRRQEIAKAHPRRGGRFVKTSNTKWVTAAELQAANTGTA